MIDKRRVTDIIFMNKPDGDLTPLLLVNPEEERLKDFRWLQYLQPKDRYDIFNTPLPPKEEKEEEETSEISNH